jgi:5-methylcytosine-specific restriction endonuclease McrA
LEIDVIVNEPCLVLNSAWQPTTFLPIGVVIATLLRDQACVIHPVTYEPLTFEQWMVRAPEDSRLIKTSNRPVPAPDVIVLKQYGKMPPQKVGFNRQNLFRRDEHSCQYCGVGLPPSKLQIEHVLPRSRKGPTSWENCVAACDACNSAKADKTPREAGMKLRKKPTTPSWKPGIRIPRGEVRPVWAQFLKQGA